MPQDSILSTLDIFMEWFYTPHLGSLYYSV